MRIEETIRLDFDDVLLKPKRSTLTSRKQVSLERTYKFLHSTSSWSAIPIIAANMDTVGTFEIADALINSNLVTAIHKHYSVDELVSFFNNVERQQHSSNLFYSIGTGAADWEKHLEVVKQIGWQPNLCIDVANGYSEGFIGFCAKARDILGENATIMAGNVVTPEVTEELLLKGVDIVKVGIGPGAMCTTRQVTGVGFPQLSATIECADAAHGLGGHICADGGIKSPGDVVKAFGAGADFVMIGSEFAGHDESGGEDVYDDGLLIGKQTYGMSSSTAMKKHYGDMATYRSSEGRTAVVPYRGPIENTVNYYLGGLRSGMTYVGASKLKELSKRTTFIRVNRILNETYEHSTTTKR